MNEIKGMKEAFEKAKVVFLTTYKDGKENSRQMTNFNTDPYTVMWFSTYRNTEKVKDIEMNSEVLVTFPSFNEGEFYEIACMEVVVFVLASPPETPILVSQRYIQPR